MVRRVLPGGLVYHEPPFTTEEQIHFYRTFGGTPQAILRGAGQAPTPKTGSKSRKREGSDPQGRPG